MTDHSGNSNIKPKIGIIGGSGVYDISGLKEATWRAVETPWGAPSDEVLTGTLDGVDMVFLPRHGRGHRLSPSDINYRANIDALKRLSRQAQDFRHQGDNNALDSRTAHLYELSGGLAASEALSISEN